VARGHAFSDHALKFYNVRGRSEAIALRFFSIALRAEKSAGQSRSRNLAANALRAERPKPFGAQKPGVSNMAL